MNQIAMRAAVHRVEFIEKEGDHGFIIGWEGGRKRRYRLAELQRQCPCANCVDENTGLRVSDPNKVPDNLRASRLHNVGRYALRIEFCTGCSNGIYGFDQIYNWGQEIE